MRERRVFVLVPEAPLILETGTCTSAQSSTCMSRVHFSGGHSSAKLHFHKQMELQKQAQAPSAHVSGASRTRAYPFLLRPGFEQGAAW